MPKTQNETESKPARDARFLSTDAAGALAALQAEGARSGALIDAWTEAGNAAAVLEVAEHGSGSNRKAARRALNVLRARGVPIPTLRRVAALADAGPEVTEAWMMAPDASGMQVFTIASRSPTGRYRAAFVFLHGAQGIARVDNATMSQSQLKDHFGKLLPGAGHGATKVPVEWARHRIAEARAAHARRGVPEPLGFTTAASLVGPPPAEAPPHPFDEEGFELAPEDAEEMAKGSAGLHNVPEFRSWLPSSEAMQEMLLNVGQKLTPNETPEPGLVTEHLKAEVAAATDRFFSEEMRTELVRRMKDSAWTALAREGEQRALEIAAAMQVVARCGLVTNPPRDVPFLKAFFDKAVALMVAQGGGKLRIPVATGGARLESAAPEPPPGA